MFCSTIIPTIGRRSLDRAVCSILDQDFPQDELEVIVVNDSGHVLPQASWMQNPHVQLVNTKQRERVFARNTGAAIAQGEYLHFLDDDDWLLPGALSAFYRLAQEHPEADWLYGATQLIDRKGRPLIELRHGIQGNGFVQIMAGEWLPLQSSLIRAEAFFKAGGFTPLTESAEDVDLCRKISLRGDIAETEKMVASIGMGRENSTTEHTRVSSRSRQGREKILSEPGVLPRLQEAAKTPYWKARAVRVYMTSAIWNVQRGRLLTAVSRSLFGLAAFVLAGKSLFKGEFWRGLRGQYVSPTFLEGFKAAGRSEEFTQR